MVDATKAVQGTQEAPNADPNFQNADKNFKTAAVTGATKFNNMGEFEKLAPEVAKLVKESIGMSMCRAWERAETRRKQLAKQYSR